MLAVTSSVAAAAAAAGYFGTEDEEAAAAAAARRRRKEGGIGCYAFRVDCSKGRIEGNPVVEGFVEDLTVVEESL